MPQVYEVVLNIPHANGEKDHILLFFPALMHPMGVKDEREHIESLVVGTPMASCLPIRAWLSWLGPDEYEGGLGEENKPISVGHPAEVLYDIAREVERRAKVPPVPGAGTDDAIRAGFLSLRFMEFRGWKKELVRSCCAALRTHDGRASAQMWIKKDAVFFLRILEEETGREASLLLEFCSLPYVAGNVLELWGLPDGVGRILENWEKVVGRVRYDENLKLNFVSVGDGEVGFDLNSQDDLMRLLARPSASPKTRRRSASRKR
jgi:hypothetical protein